MLYAAVTLRWLIDTKDDNVVLHVARVIDWPDFPRRMAVHLEVLNHGMEAYLREAGKSYFEHQTAIVRWAFRRKLNMVFRHTRPIWHVCPFDKDKWLASMEKFFQEGKPLYDYMKARGFNTYCKAFMNFGLVEDLSGRPELKGAGREMLGRGLSYTSWAFDELHRKQAEKIAEYALRIGHSSVYIHDHDNIRGWLTRDEATRARFGDDRAAAVTSMLSIYHQEFKKRGLEFGIVVLPYHPFSYDVDFYIRCNVILGRKDSALPSKRPHYERSVRENKEFLTRIVDFFPDDVLICVREGRREEMLNFYQLTGQHNLYIYFQEFQPDCGVTTRFLPATIAAFATAFDSSRTQNDIFSFLPHTKGFTTYAAAAEYAWNTQFPGGNHSMRGRSLAAFAPKANDPELMRILAERAAVGAWGYHYGQILKNVMNKDLTLAYPFFRRSIKGLRFEDYLEHLRVNKEPLRQAVKALDEAWLKDREARAKGHGYIKDAYLFEVFVAIRNIVKIARVFNYVNYAYEKANALLLEGRLKEAGQVVGEALKHLSYLEPKVKRDLSEMKGKFNPRFRYNFHPIQRVLHDGRRTGKGEILDGKTGHDILAGNFSPG